MPTTSPAPPLATVLRGIREGEIDDDLDTLAEAIKARKQVCARLAAASISPGDTVHFSDAIRPRYLVGKPATVVRINQQSIAVNCPADPSYKRFAGAQGVRCPNFFIAELG